MLTPYMRTRFGPISACGLVPPPDHATPTIPIPNPYTVNLSFLTTNNVINIVLLTQYLLFKINQNLYF